MTAARYGPGSPRGPGGAGGAATAAAAGWAAVATADGVPSRPFFASSRLQPARTISPVPDKLNANHDTDICLMNTFHPDVQTTPAQPA